jgi:hypothetical protein
MGSKIEAHRGHKRQSEMSVRALAFHSLYASAGAIPIALQFATNLEESMAGCVNGLQPDWMKRWMITADTIRTLFAGDPLLHRSHWNCRSPASFFLCIIVAIKIVVLPTPAFQDLESSCGIAAVKSNVE